MKNLCKRPVWAEINLDNLAHNMREVRRVTKKEAKVAAVIKADGYGHGSVEIGQTLLENGADMFAVATLTEALVLRDAYPKTDILILGYTPDEYVEDVIIHNLIQTIYDKNQGQVLNEKAKKHNKKVKVHIKIDTGMGRLGFLPTEETVLEICALFEMEHLILEGIYTHFAKADETDKNCAKDQNEKFISIVQALERRGVKIPVKHVSNSAAIIDLPEQNYNMVRAGIMLYGLYPSESVDHNRVKLKQVMSLKAKLAHVKTVPEGVGLSYGHVYTTDKKSLIGTLPIGYADGYTRMYTGKGQVIFSGKRHPVVGRICMDQCMVDLTGESAVRGDEVILFGNDQSEFISVDEVASWMGTINYETVCMIGKRVPRVYKKSNKNVAVHDTLLCTTHEKLNG